MLIRRRISPLDGAVLPSEITPQQVYLQRRAFMASAGALAAASWLGSDLAEATLPSASKSPLSTSETMNSRRDITSYNNFYEFGTDKSDPARLAGSFKPLPWTVQVGGLCAKPRTWDMAELLKLVPLEERIYRLRCVEGWSMVIPWVGFPLAALLQQAQPLGSAKFVRLTTVVRPKELPGQRSGVLDWPYVEGLRLDEALHPLTILAVGLYGEVLPNQNGAPIRLVVPWKYGFKSIKSIVGIELVEAQPTSSWMRQAPNEYGFYANVNPAVDHPRWSQATERRIGEFFKRKTLPFNGYAEQVAGLYRGMDLARFY